jgi:hypothetical protein
MTVYPCLCLDLHSFYGALCNNVESIHDSECECRWSDLDRDRRADDVVGRKSGKASRAPRLGLKLTRTP